MSASTNPFTRARIATQNKSLTDAVEQACHTVLHETPSACLDDQIDAVVCLLPDLVILNVREIVSMIADRLEALR